MLADSWPLPSSGNRVQAPPSPSLCANCSCSVQSLAPGRLLFQSISFHVHSTATSFQQPRWLSQGHHLLPLGTSTKQHPQRGMAEEGTLQCDDVWAQDSDNEAEALSGMSVSDFPVARLTLYENGTAPRPLRARPFLARVLHRWNFAPLTHRSLRQWARCSARDGVDASLRPLSRRNAVGPQQER